MNELLIGSRIKTIKIIHKISKNYKYHFEAESLKLLSIP